MNEDVSVRIEDLGFGYKSEVPSVLIHYRQIPCAGIFKGLHYLSIGKSNGRIASGEVMS